MIEGDNWIGHCNSEFDLHPLKGNLDTKLSANVVQLFGFAAMYAVEIKTCLIQGHQIAPRLAVANYGPQWLFPEFSTFLNKSINSRYNLLYHKRSKLTLYLGQPIIFPFQKEL